MWCWAYNNFEKIAEILKNEVFMCCVAVDGFRNTFASWQQDTVQFLCRAVFPRVEVLQEIHNR